MVYRSPWHLAFVLAEDDAKKVPENKTRKGTKIKKKKKKRTHIALRDIVFLDEESKISFWLILNWK